MLALDRGFHVICDKPLANDLAQAREIAARAKTTNAEFCVTYCYTGFPMVRQAHDMIRAGELGEIRQVHLQYVQSYLAGHICPQAGVRKQDARAVRSC
jgi:predicted dehydrogenase